MGDYLCKYCQDKGCKICERLCEKCGKWVFKGDAFHYLDCKKEGR